MAQCVNWRERLSARLDGQLDPAEASTLAEHLDACPSCRAYASRLAVAHGAIGRLESRHPVPSPLLARIEAGAIRCAPHIERRRRMWGAGGAALAAALAVLVLGPRLFSSSDRRLPDLCTALVEDHIRYLPREDVAEVRSDDPATLDRWFADRLDFSLRVPALPGARLIGGRQCFISGHKVALLFYERAGGRISLFGLPEIPLGGMRPHPDGTWAGGMHGYQVRAVRANGTTYAAVSDLDEGEMGRLVASIGRAP